MTRAHRKTDHRLMFFVLCIGGFSYSLLQSLVAPVLPTLQHAFDTDQETVTWVLTAYLVSASVFTPLIGRIGDKVGKKRMLVFTLVALSVGAGVSAMAPTIGVLVLGRVVQGIGGGLLPLTFGIIRDEFPEDRVAGAIGTSAALLAVGGGLALVVAGPVVDLLGFRWLFWLPMIVTLLAAVAVHVCVPESPIRTPGRINVVTALLMSAWLVCLLLGVSQGESWGWGSSRVIGLLVASVVIAVVWVRVEFVSDAPLIDMQMMRLPAVWTCNLVALLVGVVLYTVFAFLPQFLQADDGAGYGFGVSVTVSGLLLLPQAAGTFFMGLLSGRLAARFGSKRVLVFGASGTAVAMIGLTFAHDHLWQLVLVSSLNGASFGLTFAAMSNIVVESVPQHQTGVASGMNANIRTVGGAIGAAVVASIIAATAGADGVPTEAGYTHGFLLLTVCAIGAVLVSLLIPTSGLPEPEVLVGEVRTPEMGMIPGGQLVTDSV